MKRSTAAWSASKPRSARLPRAEATGGPPILKRAQSRHEPFCRWSPSMPETIVLAYSGGLDTSVATKWLQEERGYDVVCLMVDLGRLPDVAEARARGLSAGAKAVDVVDARADFLRYFVFPG